MNKNQRGGSKTSSTFGLEALIEASEREIPGVLDVLDLYSNYEELAQLIQEYEDITNPEPYSTTSNNSNPTLQSG